MAGTGTWATVLSAAPALVNVDRSKQHTMYGLALFRYTADTSFQGSEGQGQGSEATVLVDSTVFPLSPINPDKHIVGLNVVSICVARTRVVGKAI